MQFLKEFYRRLSWLFSRSRFRSELADEIEFHIESRVEELEQAGASRAEALTQAHREFGPRLKAAEDSSGPWQMQWLENLFSDLRYAARAFRRSPGFAATAIFCLAVGIGANAVMFNITTNFLFSQPTCRDASSLIAIWEGGNSAAPLSDYQFLRDAHIFAGTAGLDIDAELNWRNGDHTRRLFAGLVSDDFFTTLDIPFQFGRGILPRETNTAVLSDRAWHGEFGGDPAILGRRLILDGRLYTVAGVLPADYRSIFGFGVAPDVYIPVPNDDNLMLYARLPKGMTIPMARDRLKSIFAQLDRLHPNEGWKRGRAAETKVTHVTGFDLLSQMIPGAVTAFFAMIMVVACLVLLIACANVASLLLARATTRSHELAIRLSLGAGRGRIIRHLLAESLLLSLLGCFAGLLVALLCANLVSKVDLALPVPVHLIVSPDWRLLCYSLATALLCGLLCGLLPALKAVRKDVSSALSQGQRQTARTWNLRSVLVAAQLAVSILLLATALLFVHNLLRATSMDPGFDLHHTVWAYMRLAPGKYAGANQTKQNSLVLQALDQLRSLPGVESAAITQRVPLNDNCVAGAPVKTDLSSAPIHVEYECNDVGPQYFHTMGIPILLGREFTAADRKGSQPVAIVNESFARALFGKTNPVGHVMTIKFQDWTSMLIVGVAKDSKYFSLGEKQRLALYQPYFAHDKPVNLHFLIRTTGSPASSVRAITGVLGRLDTTAAIETKPMNQALGLALLPSRVGAVMLGAMGILGLALAAIGLYGLLLYSVSRRTREIGLRVALGATPSAVLRLICRHSLALVGSGSLVGLTLAAFAMQPLALFLVPGLSTFDPTAFLSVVGVLGAVALLATLAPAIRALRVDPMTALRYE